jgi:hypothetical protein
MACWTIFIDTGLTEYPPYTLYMCASNLSIIPADGFPGRSYILVDGAVYGGGGYGSTLLSGQLFNYLKSPEAPYTRGPFGDCIACPESNRYDCVNAVCVSADYYQTPGFYASLEDCKLSCGTGCSGKCISNERYSLIESLASEVRGTIC